MSAQNNKPILNYVSLGEGIPIILIHGLATSHHDWEPMIPQLVDKGFHILAVDLFGHGDSPKPNMHKLYTFKVVYGTLEEWIDSLEIERPFFLAGHSMGGYMSLMYALRHPEDVRALSLLDPLFSLKHLPPFMINTHRLSAIGVEMLKVAPQKLVEIALGWGPTVESDFTPQIRDRIVNDVKRASPYVLNIASTLPDLTYELGKIETPCQVIWGDQDGLLNPASFPKMVAAMPHATGHVLAGRGHQPHLGNPEQVNNLVMEFLDAHIAPKVEIITPVFIEKRSRAERKAEILGKIATLVDELFDRQVELDQPSLSQIEDLALEAREQVGIDLVTLLLEESLSASIGASPPCPNCGGRMRFSGEQTDHLETRLGAIELQAGHFLCPACGKILAPEWAH